MREVLADLAAIDGVEGSFLAGQDGLVVCADGEAREGADLRAALIVAVFATVERAISQLAVGEARYVTIDTSTHTLHIAGFGDLLLVVIAERRANPALIRWEIRRAARRLAEASA